MMICFPPPCPPPSPPRAPADMAHSVNRHNTAASPRHSLQRGRQSNRRAGPTQLAYARRSKGGPRPRVGAKARTPARLRQPEPRTRLAVLGVPRGALCTHSAWHASLWGGLVTCRVLVARAPVLGLCFFVSANAGSPIYMEKLPRNSIPSQCRRSASFPRRIETRQHY